MTIGGLSLDGNVVEYALFAAVLALLAAMFLVGRLAGLGHRGGEQHSIDALRQLRAEEEERNKELRQEREGILKEGLRAQDALDRWDAVKRDYEALEAMRRELDEFEREESSRIDKMELRRAEAARRLGETQAALDSYPAEIVGDDVTWNELIEERKRAYDQLRQEREEIEKAYTEADARRLQAVDEASMLERKKSQLDDAIKTAQELLDRITQGQVDILKPQNEQLIEEASRLQSEIDALNEELSERRRKLSETKKEIDHASAELLATQNASEAVSGATIEFPADTLSVAVKEMPGRTATASGDEKLSAFRIMPDCLLGYENVRAEMSEDDLLGQFEVALKELGLQYPTQIIRAFHTALKVNDLSPLTVLSGLSGTGKSQLPRVYARFFGIHFLHVPVEPGWDSPQDLLGFYDFVAERYRPTDRARALGHFDSQFSEDIGIEGGRGWNERMLLILLDEMNLARTEYYFSEFLSRLEMRGPRTNVNGDEDSREDAQIAIDLPYAEGERPKHLYVPHNVLWVGTLNEDETTQALSDKVLDRANSIRFAPPEPSTLRAHSTAPARSIKGADGFLPYERWLEWSTRETAAQIGIQHIEETLEELADLMQSAGRGFGYRIAQSITAYIKRYPGQDWRAPMIDQINMRLLPKLSGAEMNDCQASVDGLRQLSEETLGDPAFARALQDAATSSEVSQIFTWPGYTYE